MPKLRDHDLSEMQSGGVQEGKRNSANGDRRVSVAARRLAIHFTEEINLPIRFRKPLSSAQLRKINANSEVEKRFRVSIISWTQLIDTMLAKISSRQAWRFIGLSPEIHPTARTLTECKDFLDFVDYLILRRNTEKCGADELGGLAQLLTAFQREIEKKV